MSGRGGHRFGDNFCMNDDEHIHSVLVKLSSGPAPVQLIVVSAFPALFSNSLSPVSNMKKEL